MNNEYYLRVSLAVDDEGLANMIAEQVNQLLLAHDINHGNVEVRCTIDDKAEVEDRDRDR